MCNYDDTMLNSNGTLTITQPNVTIQPTTTSIFSGGYSPLYNLGNLTFTKNESTTNSTIEITGEDADLKINGKSLKNFMNKVEERLLILQPDPKKLEKYEALRKAYEHYKLMEKLIGDE